MDTPLSSKPPRLGDRSLFGRLRPRAYLNHCAISPASEPVEAAVSAMTDAFAREGVGAFALLRERRESARARLARLVGADTSEIGFVANTSAGVTAVALSWPWRRGDAVVVFEGEFPANVVPWMKAAEVFGLRVVRLPLEPLAAPGGADLGPLEAALRAGGVRLVALSAVQYRSGLRAPLAEVAALCHAHGALLFVDAIQALGVVPLPLRDLGVDFAAASAHKWLMGMPGVGVLYVAREHLASLRPAVASWLSLEDPVGFLGPTASFPPDYDRAVRREASFVEGGMAPAAPLAALDASLSLLEQLGVQSIWKHVQAYLDALEDRLVALGFASLRMRDEARRSGILSLVPPPGTDLAAIGHALDDAGVSCSTPAGVLRFAPHWPNALDEVEFVASAVRAAIDAHRA